MSAKHPHDPETNPDAITGAHGSHPIGTGVGATGGGLAGVAAGFAIGAASSGPAAPIGGAIGAIIGAVAGGLAGKGVAESVNPTDEDAFWREHHKSRPYYDAAHGYDEYAPAYRYGWESREKFQGKSFDDVESEMGQDWDSNKGRSSFSWDKAKVASRDAWHRVESQLPTNADRDEVR